VAGAKKIGGTSFQCRTSDLRVPKCLKITENF
jgi:hypothetical protein